MLRAACITTSGCLAAPRCRPVVVCDKKLSFRTTPWIALLFTIYFRHSIKVVTTGKRRDAGEGRGEKRGRGVREFGVPLLK